MCERYANPSRNSVWISVEGLNKIYYFISSTNHLCSRVASRLHTRESDCMRRTKGRRRDGTKGTFQQRSIDRTFILPSISTVAWTARVCCIDFRADRRARARTEHFSLPFLSVRFFFLTKRVLRLEVCSMEIARTCSATGHEWYCSVFGVVHETIGIQWATPFTLNRVQ